ncbi:hypothetical protein THICB2_280077 [Thiomonas sp. CB2]|nr:hypothetical protein THICB2_280077 [Thiomonas sp. CB2]VDY05420.1 protein of unknown function [Thiomonas sp. Bio17B3]
MLGGAVSDGVLGVGLGVALDVVFPPPPPQAASNSAVLKAAMTDAARKKADRLVCGMVAASGLGQIQVGGHRRSIEPQLR